MVSSGFALAHARDYLSFAKYAWRYYVNELVARWHGYGFWAGTFTSPEKFRYKRDTEIEKLLKIYLPQGKNNNNINPPSTEETSNLIEKYGPQ